MPSPSENEVPAGLVNGTTGFDGNPVFTLAYLPADVNQLHLYVAGYRMRLGIHFTVSGQTITFLAPFIPVAGDFILADYPF